MERKEIRGMLAYLSFAAEDQGDHDLAMLLAQVHCAILDDQVELLSEYMRDFAATDSYPTCRGVRTYEVNTPAVLLEQSQGA